MQIIDEIKALPRIVRVLLTTNAVSAFGGGLVLPYLWIYLTDGRGLDKWVPAAVLSVQAVIAFGAAAMWGWAFDRWSPRTGIPAVMVVAAVGTALFALATNPGLALLAGIVYGAGISGVGTALRVMYGSQTRTNNERMTAFSVDFGLLNVFSGLGVLLGGALVALDVGSLADRLAALYVVDGATFLFTAVAVFAMLPVSTPSSGSSRPEGYARLLATPWFLLCVGVLFLQLLVSTAQLKSGFSAYLTTESRIPPATLSVFFGVNIAVAVLAQFVLMPRLTRVARRGLLITAGVLAAVSWAFVYAAGQLPGGTAVAAGTVAMVTLSLAEAFCVPLVSTIINNRVGDDNRGRANAAISMTISASSAAGPALTGVLLGVCDGTLLLGFLAAAGLLSSLLAMAMTESALTEMVPEVKSEAQVELS